ncbi:MAG: HlyD family efflux transporter periplasmic adaptor subunit [Bacteroidetes bacterium]|nr:HlyD family efflux transporter periplasmic adaptor subunit [Bacteroidota bacterium]
MFGREIFRKSTLQKMTSPEDLDELLQVNSTRTWLLFSAISMVIAGMLLWGFFGSITQNVKGFGIIKTLELPREVVAIHAGQVDSVFCKTGDLVSRDQRLLKVYLLEEKTYAEIFSPFDGKITGLNVKEGTYVNTGTPVLEMMRNRESSAITPEVIFFVAEQDISNLKTKMIANLEIARKGVPIEFLKGRITFIANYPASRSAIQMYFPNEGKALKLSDINYYEVRASLLMDTSEMSATVKEVLYSLNGLSCRVVVTTATHSPVEFLLN